ncbi:M50 family metallopeptidase [Frondihabitans australicus]|uniref:Peptidase M50B-like protein n=1 Tax=Frondihabitans australicus TaxID=386892 RepID=A0A495IEU9_9MICO|nr:M50 family metallopeptidase [Frondihabitans australicus]RKR74513.1 peptidase M50B-like protein [Frondihabitans australicus]
MHVLESLWSRATQTSEPLGVALLFGSLAVGLVLVLLPGTWHTVRHAVTVVHEGGHGLAAVLTGRRLTGIRLHSDTSGLTVSKGPRTGFGMVITLLAGYTAPALAGLGAAWMLHRGYASGLLWALLVVLALMLVQIRNWFGLWVILVGAAVVFAVTWFAAPEWQLVFGHVLTAVLALGALRASLELQSSRRRTRSAQSDADQLARLTRVPGLAWVFVFVLVALACAVADLWMLVPQGLLTMP